MGGRLASVHASYLSKYLESTQEDLEIVGLLVGFFLDHLNASEFFSWSWEWNTSVSGLGYMVVFGKLIRHRITAPDLFGLAIWTRSPSVFFVPGPLVNVRVQWTLLWNSGMCFRWAAYSGHTLLLGGKNAKTRPLLSALSYRCAISNYLMCFPFLFACVSI